MHEQNQPSSSETKNYYQETMIVIAKMLFPALLANSHTDKQSEMIAAFLYDSLSAVAVALAVGALSELNGGVQVSAFVVLSVLRMALGEYGMAQVSKMTK